MHYACNSIFQTGVVVTLHYFACLIQQVAINNYHIETVKTVICILMQFSIKNDLTIGNPII